MNVNLTKAMMTYKPRQVPCIGLTYILLCSHHNSSSHNNPGSNDNCSSHHHINRCADNLPDHEVNVAIEGVHT